MKKTEEAKMNEVNTELQVAEPVAAEEPKTEGEEATKKGFWKSLGKGAKIGIGVAAGAAVAGVAWLIGNLLGGKDDDEGDEATEETGESDE